MKRFIAVTGILTALLAVGVQAQEVEAASINCTQNWVFTYSGKNDYFSKFIMNGWNKYSNNQNNKNNVTTVTTEATTAVISKPVTETTEKPTETTTETTTKVTTEVTQKPAQTTVSKPSEASTTQNNTQSNAQTNAQSKTMEEQVVDLVNKYRAENGLKALKINPEVSKVAQAKSEDMRDKNYFDHTSPTYGSPFNMLKNFGISYKTAGENIAKGQKTAEAVVNAWMNSEGHRKNILNPNYEEIGVGYATGKGSTYWTQLFIKQ